MEVNYLNVFIFNVRVKEQKQKLCFTNDYPILYLLHQFIPSNYTLYRIQNLKTYNSQMFHEKLILMIKSNN